MREEKDSPKIPWELTDLPTPPDALPKEAVLSPEAAVALNVESLNHYGIAKGETREELVAKLYERGAAIVAGDFTMVKRMLAAQLTMLERLANYFMTRAYQLRDYPERHDRLMRMAMRAQNQLVRTTEALKKLSKQEPAKEKAKAPVAAERPATERGVDLDQSAGSVGLVGSVGCDEWPVAAEQPPSDCCCPAP